MSSRPLRNEVVLFLEVVDIVSQVLGAHFGLLPLAVCFREVASDKPLCAVGVDVNKVGSHEVAVADEHSQGEHTDIISLGPDHDEGDQHRESHNEYLSCYSVEADARVVRVEEIGLQANCLALPSSVTVRDPTEVDVGIGVSPRQVNQAATAAADAPAAAPGLSAFPLGVTLSWPRITRKRSNMMQRMLRKALRKEPATTLPKFLQK